MVWLRKLLPVVSLTSLLGCGRGLDPRPGEAIKTVDAADGPVDRTSHDAEPADGPALIDVAPDGPQDVTAAAADAPPSFDAGAPDSQRTTDDGAPSMTGDAGVAPPPGCPAGAHCWGFEQDPVGLAPGAPWTVVPGIDLQGHEPGVEVASRADGRGKAVHVSGVGQAFSYFSLQTADVDPGLAVELSGRMMMKIDAEPGDRWVMIDADSNHGGTTVGYVYGAYQLVPEGRYEDGDVDCRRSGSTSMLVKSWSCIEWHFRGPSPAHPDASDMELWIDGCPATATNSTGGATVCDDGKSHAWRAPSFDNLHLGVAAMVASTTVPYSVWIDDVAIAPGPQRLGCPQNATPVCR